MKPIEEAMRAACEHMGVTLESWCSQEDLRRADPEALMDILPPKPRLIARWVYDERRKAEP